MRSKKTNLCQTTLLKKPDNQKTKHFMKTAFSKREFFSKLNIIL